jgi:IclR family pca regulon transcriptional regulator
MEHHVAVREKKFVVAKKSIKNVDYVESFARGLSVLRAFGPGREQLTLSDVARLCDLQRSAARRFLLTLCALGYAAQSERFFSLTPKILELGYSYLSGLRVPALLVPTLAEVTRQLGESSSASILDGDDIVYIARSSSPLRLMSMSLGIGTRLPAYATSMGQVLLAHLPPARLEESLARLLLKPLTASTITSMPVFRERLRSVRERGYAVNDQELEEGLRSLAAPVAGPDGEVRFAVNVACNAARVSMADIETRCLPVLLAAAAQCARTIGMLPAAG